MFLLKIPENYLGGHEAYTAAVTPNYHNKK